MFKMLAGIKTQIIITVLVSGIAFGSGFYTKSQFFKADQAQLYQDALELIVGLNIDKRKAAEELQNAKNDREVRIETITEQIKVFVPDDRRCDLNAGSVGLLKAAIGDTLPTAFSGSSDGN